MRTLADGKKGVQVEEARRVGVHLARWCRLHARTVDRPVLERRTHEIHAGAARASDALLLGRETYEILPPHALEEDRIKHADMKQPAEVFVSTTLKEVAWNNSRLLTATSLRKLPP